VRNFSQLRGSLKIEEQNYYGDNLEKRKNEKSNLVHIEMQLGCELRFCYNPKSVGLGSFTKS
jgi:hypothetical protein